MTEKADSQQIKNNEFKPELPWPHPDRNGATITNHEETPSLMIFPSLVDDADSTASSLADILIMDQDSIYRKIEGFGDEETMIRYLPFVAKSNLTTEEVSAIQSLNEPGLFIVGQVGRYQSGLPAIHLLGELRVIVTENDLLSGKAESGAS